MTAFLIGEHGPGVFVPARVASILYRQPGVAHLKVRARGVDPEVAAVLEALRLASEVWNGNGGEVTKEPVKPREKKEWLGTTEAADLVGVSNRAVLLAIQRETLTKTTREGGRWKVHRSECEAWRAKRGA